MGNSLSDFTSTADYTTRWVAAVLSHLDWMILLVALAVVGGATWQYWGREFYNATLGRILCTDPRDLVLCGCLHCGWCIMNVCCPWVCPKYHPLFRLRIIIVKARHLADPSSANSRRRSLAVYAEVRAGNNPTKTTSVQTYDGPGMRTVWWNEPIDMVMHPSATSVNINLYHKGASELWLGSVNVPVDSFYEAPGTISNATLCGESCPRLCHRFLGTKYHWPFVRGAPNTSEWRLVMRQENSCCHSPLERERWEIIRDARHTVLYKGPSWPGETETPSNGGKRAAMQEVTKHGMALQHLPAALRSDKDVVLAAVRQDSTALQFAAHSLQSDSLVQRAAANAPEPLLLRVERGDEDTGRLWVYFIMHGIDEDEELPQRTMLEV